MTAWLRSAALPVALLAGTAATFPSQPHGGSALWGAVAAQALLVLLGLARRELAAWRSSAPTEPGEVPWQAPLCMRQVRVPPTTSRCVLHLDHEGPCDAGEPVYLSRVR